MSKQISNEDQLLQALRDLPRSVRPRRDLWPGIAGSLRERRAAPRTPRGAWSRHALAASVAVAFVAGVLLGRELVMDAPTATDEAGASSAWRGNPAVMAAIRASEREYQASFKSMAPLKLARQYVGTSAAQDIEAGWTALKQAETALLAALDEYPDNPFLGAKLVDLRTQQLDFIRHLHMLDQNSRRQI